MTAPVGHVKESPSFELDVGVLGSSEVPGGGVWEKTFYFLYHVTGTKWPQSLWKELTRVIYTAVWSYYCVSHRLNGVRCVLQARAGSVCKNRFLQLWDPVFIGVPLTDFFVPPWNAFKCPRELRAVALAGRCSYYSSWAKSRSIMYLVV